MFLSHIFNPLIKMGKFIRFILVFYTTFCVHVLFAQNPGNTTFADKDTSFIYHQLQHAQNIYLTYPDSSAEIANDCLYASRKINYRTGIGLSFSVTGHVYWVKSYNTVSMFYLRNALVYLEQSAPPADIAECYRMLSRCLTDAHNLKLGWEYLSKAKQITLTLKNKRLVSAVYNDLARYFSLQKQFDAAIDIAKEGIAFARSANDTSYLAILYSRYANILSAMQNYNEAEKYYDSSFTLNIHANNKRLRAILYNDFAGLDLMKNNLDECVLNANRSMLLADTLGAYFIKLESLNLLLKVYDRKNDLTKKNQCLQQLNNFRDSIDYVQNKNNVRLMEEYLWRSNRVSYE